jgi:alpha-L-arabinofuranosidase
MGKDSPLCYIIDLYLCDRKKGKETGGIWLDDWNSWLFVAGFLPLLP